MIPKRARDRRFYGIFRLHVVFEFEEEISLLSKILNFIAPSLSLSLVKQNMENERKIMIDGA